MRGSASLPAAKLTVVEPRAEKKENGDRFGKVRHGGEIERPEAKST